MPPAPRRGVLALFDQPTFNLQSLPAIPSEQHAFAALSIDLAKFYEQFAALVRPTDVNTQSPLDALDNAFRQQFGLNLREDVLRPLGPKVAIYAQPTAAPPPGNPLAALVTPYTGMTISIQVRDHAAFSAQFDQLVKAINQVLAQRPAGGADPPQFHKKNGPNNEYVLEFPPGSAPEGVVALLSPTIALDKEQLIISGTSAAAEKALTLTSALADRRWSPTGDFVPMAQRLPGKMVILNVADPRETLPVLIDNLPAIAQAYNSQVEQASRMAQARGGRPGPDMSIRLDANKLPTGEQLRPLLFPASTAVSVDANGIHLLQREAIPSLTSPTSASVMVALLLPAVQAVREAARRAPSAPTISSRFSSRVTITLPPTTPFPRITLTRTASPS